MYGYVCWAGGCHYHIQINKYVNDCYSSKCKKEELT